MKILFLVASLESVNRVIYLDKIVSLLKQVLYFKVNVIQKRYNFRPKHILSINIYTRPFDF